MRAIFNDSFEINPILRVNEIMEANFSKRLVLIIPYNQTNFESIENFLKENSIDNIKIYEDNKLINLFIKYKTFQKLQFTNGTAGNYIEFQIGETQEQ